MHCGQAPQRADTGADARSALTAAWWTSAICDGTRPPYGQHSGAAAHRTSPSK